MDIVDRVDIRQKRIWEVGRHRHLVMGLYRVQMGIELRRRRRGIRAVDEEKGQ
jgi:hypothetical protein